MFRRFLWNFIEWAYAHMAKPILFLFSPDQMHASMLKFSIVMWRVPFLRGFVKLVFKRLPNQKLTQKINGLTFNNPVGLAAGFDKNGEIIPTINALGFGFGTIGSVTARQCAGNPKPWFYRLPNSKAAVINAGLANDGCENILNRVKEYPKKAMKNFPTILSVAKTNSCEVVKVQDGVDDYIHTLKKAQRMKNIEAFEINISCPNAFGGEDFTSPTKLNKLLKSVSKLKIKKPIFVKMPIDLEWSKFKDLLDICVKYNISGVTIANLLKDRKKADLQDDLPDSIKGNLSGKPTWDDSNELIRQTYLEYGDKLTIIGVGGIFSAKEAYEKMRLGASLIEIISGVIFTGPQLAAQINDGILRYMKRDGYNHVSQIIGVDAYCKKDC